MSKLIISTPNAPAAVGPYSQAAKAVGNITFLSGQIGLHPHTGELVQPYEAQVRQAFANMSAVVAAAGGQLSDVVKLTLYVTDMAQFPVVNAIMAELMPQPFCARSTVGVASLPKAAEFEVEAIVAIEAAEGF
jgi:2-iminobutanoate/2-iminopropanoate deaminase